jgi:hypothetical protein
MIVTDWLLPVQNLVLGAAWFHQRIVAASFGQASGSNWGHGHEVTGAHLWIL